MSQTRRILQTGSKVATRVPPQWLIESNSILCLINQNVHLVLSLLFLLHWLHMYTHTHIFTHISEYVHIFSFIWASGVRIQVIHLHCKHLLNRLIQTIYYKMASIKCASKSVSEIQNFILVHKDGDSWSLGFWILHTKIYKNQHLRWLFKWSWHLSLLRQHVLCISTKTTFYTDFKTPVWFTCLHAMELVFVLLHVSVSHSNQTHPCFCVYCYDPQT